jgi:predicted aspartyl protease
MNRPASIVSHYISLTLLACISISPITYSQGLNYVPLPTISVGVNGKTGMFLIDTGSSQSVIDSSFAHQLGLNPTGKAIVRKNYAIEELSTVLAEHLQLGNNGLSAHNFLESDLSAMSRALSVSLAGILGADVLTTTYVKLIYSSGVAQVVTNIDDVGKPVKLKKMQDGFFVPVRIGPSEFDLLLDSGTNSTAISNSAWQELPFSRTPNSLIEGIRSADSDHHTALACTPTLKLGDAILRDQPLRVIETARSGNFSNSMFTGILGGDVLGHFEVTLDLGHSLLYLKPDPTYRSDPYALVTIGIQFFKAKMGGFSVAAVWKHSPAEEAGIKVGDQIISVNGNQSADLDLKGFSEQLHQPAGTRVTLEVERPTGLAVVYTITRRLGCVF